METNFGSPYQMRERKNRRKIWWMTQGRLRYHHNYWGWASHPPVLLPCVNPVRTMALLRLCPHPRRQAAEPMAGMLMFRSKRRRLRGMSMSSYGDRRPTPRWTLTPRPGKGVQQLRDISGHLRLPVESTFRRMNLQIARSHLTELWVWHPRLSRAQAKQASRVV